MRRVGRVAALMTLLALGACTPPVGPLRMPIDSIQIPARCPPAKLRILMLPGAYSKASDFTGEGMVDALTARGIDAELVLIDAHYGYYMDGSIVERISRDFLRSEAPPTWIVGISLGGFGALATAAEHGERIAGVVALSPYPGTRDTQREVLAQGGLVSWAAASDPTQDEHERRLYRWLATAPTTPPIYIGLAESDRFIDGQRLLSSTIASARVDQIPGGHDWTAWRRLWERFLDRGVLNAAATSSNCRSGGDR